jgi:NADH:ubiquinone oxidoreductase subunit F (NADH-binding)
MSTIESTIAETRPFDRPLASAPALPRLLAGIHEHGHLTIREHLEIHGPLAPVRGSGRRHGRDDAQHMIEEIERSGLLGHGGAAFPVATKMRAVAGARGRAIVVVNATEGEPASLKDRTLLEMLPHLVLDGGVVAAEALGADELIVCTCETSATAYESAALAIEERTAHRIPGPRIELVTVPRHYVAGQESALVNYLNGGPALPTFTPPMVFERGVKRRPTLVNNAETLAHIGMIARRGATWFRQLGTAAQPGSALVTLSGPVAHPGVYEIEHGASLSSLIEAGGGPTGRVRGALIGGYAGAWIAGPQLHGVALSKEHLAPLGATLGAGVVLLLSEQACPVAETARVARWMSQQSARQCGPCVHGLDTMAQTIEEIAGGVADARATQRVDRLASLVARRGACGHPDGALNLILSALEAFAGEFADHAQHGPCEGCARAPELPLPNRPVNRDTRRAARVSG